MRDPAAPLGDDMPEAMHLRTAWHPLLILLLQQLLPRDLFDVLAEYTLTREPRRIDVVIVRRVAEQGWRPSYLRSLLDDLRAHNLVHFKGATDELEGVDAPQLLSYAYQYLALNKLTQPDALALRVVAPTLTPRFRGQLTVLGGVLAETAVPGVHEGSVQGFSLRVVETTLAWPTPGEQLLFPISPACLTASRRPRALDDTELALYDRLLQGISQLSLDPRWRDIMKDAAQVSDATRQALMDLLAVIPPEQRLAGLAPEQRLAGLAPEQRLAGLAPEEVALVLSEADHVLALPDAALRALPESYLSTLPVEAQARIRARLAR